MAVATAGYKSIPINLTGLPQKLTSETVNAKEFEIYNTTGNSSIKVGGLDTLTDAIPRTGGTIISFTLEYVPGEVNIFDLSKIYVSGTIGDVITLQYVDRK